MSCGSNLHKNYALDKIEEQYREYKAPRFKGLKSHNAAILNANHFKSSLSHSSFRRYLTSSTGRLGQEKWQNVSTLGSRHVGHQAWDLFRVRLDYGQRRPVMASWAKKDVLISELQRRWFQS